MSFKASTTTKLSYTFSFFFFGGLSIHLSTALLAHLFSYNITWGATKKVRQFIDSRQRCANSNHRKLNGQISGLKFPEFGNGIGPHSRCASWLLAQSLFCQ